MPSTTEAVTWDNWYQLHRFGSADLNSLDGQAIFLVDRLASGDFTPQTNSDF